MNVDPPKPYRLKKTRRMLPGEKETMHEMEMASNFYLPLDVIHRIWSEYHPNDPRADLTQPKRPDPTKPWAPAPPVTPEEFTDTKWAYQTPLESPQLLAHAAATDEPNSDIRARYDFTLHPRVIYINGMPFQERSDCFYRKDPYRIFDEIELYKRMTPQERKAEPGKNEANLIRHMIRDDLWFFVYFIMKHPLANHPFIVEACHEIQNEKGDSIEVWARDHLKTTIISVARSCQKVLIDPEKRIAIMSATRPLALKIQNMIRRIFESKFLIRSFPDILFDNPKMEAPKWTDAPEGGLVVKRQGISYKEPTISAWGLIEGMPTGDHYTDIVCDDIVTQDQQSPEIIEKVVDNFEQVYSNIASAHGEEGSQMTVVGTYYRHDDPLVRIGEMKDPITSQRLFKIRKKTATIDGTFNGKPVFLRERVLNKKRAGKKYTFFCQQLLDPTPRGEESLRGSDIVMVRRGQMPMNAVRIMTIDGAGDKGRRTDGRKSDAWAIGVYGIGRTRDSDGMHDVFIMDLCIKEMPLADACKEIVKMVMRNGPIKIIGVEKVGMSTTEIHVAAALKAKGRHYTEERGNLVILSPGGRSKQYRIESAIQLPLQNSKVHMVDTVPAEMQQRILLEMEKFPAWKDDGLDGLSYVWDITSRPDFTFSHFNAEKEEERPDAWEEAFLRAEESRLTDDGYIEV